MISMYFCTYYAVVDLSVVVCGYVIVDRQFIDFVYIFRVYTVKAGLVIRNNLTYNCSEFFEEIQNEKH